MRVAVVCPYAFDVHGGVQDQVARIVGWLRDAGHESWAVAPGSGGPEGTRHVGGFALVPANRSRAPISLDPRVVRRVSRAVEDADVVHIHEPFMPLVSLGAVFADTPPTVGTFHADPGAAARRLYRTAAALLRRIAARLDVVTAVSEVAAAALGKIASPRLVPNGVDLDDFRSIDVERMTDRVVFVGRDDPRKGVNVLLEAWPKVAARHPGASLHVVGLDRLPGTPGVVFVGPVGDEVKRAELGAASVLAAPNLGGESFGIVVLEGMAAGCAIVASDLPAFRAVAEDAASYVEPGDALELAAALSAVLASPDRVRSMKEAGRERSASFGREEVLAGYLEAYEMAMNRA
ncbi:MAG: glycosyltransferase family 4 protein [Acidimicrobiia bacterium]